MSYTLAPPTEKRTILCWVPRYPVLTKRVTMSSNETGTHKKRRIAHPWVFRGTASAPFVPAQCLRAHGNSLSPHPRPLSTVVLARTIGKLPKHLPAVSTQVSVMLMISTGSVEIMAWNSSHLFLIERAFINTIRSPPTGWCIQRMVTRFPKGMGLGRARVAHHHLDHHLGRTSSSD